MMNENRRIICGKNINFNLEMWNYEGSYIIDEKILVNRDGFLGFFGFKKSIGTEYIAFIPSIAGYDEYFMAGKYIWVPKQRDMYNFPTEKEAINFLEDIKIYVDSQYKPV